MFSLREEIKKIKTLLANIDKETLLVLLSIPFITTISWYFASRTFFKENFYSAVIEDGYNADLFEICYWLITDSLIFIIIPLIILLFLRKNIFEYGFKLQNFRKGIILTILTSLLIIPFVWVISSSEDFIQYYPTVSGSDENFNILLIYLTGLIIYVFAWEFLWRGYLQFSLEKKFGVYAILIQVIPFVLMHNGKPVAETFSAIAGGIFLGYLAYRSRTFLWGFLLHFLLMFYIEIISFLRYQNNEYGIGFNSIINILL